jgi:hypothetical protein
LEVERARRLRFVADAIDEGRRKRAEEDTKG